MRPRELLEHAAGGDAPRPRRRRAPALRRARPARAICWSCPRSATSATRAGSARLNPALYPDAQRLARAARTRRRPDVPLSATTASSRARPTRPREVARRRAGAARAAGRERIRSCGGIPPDLQARRARDDGPAADRAAEADKGERAASERGVTNTNAWQTHRGARAGGRQRRTTDRIVTATELPRGLVETRQRPAMAGNPAQIEIERVPRAAARPHGAALRHAGPCDTLARRARRGRGGDCRVGALLWPCVRRGRRRGRGRRVRPSATALGVAADARAAARRARECSLRECALVA